MRVFRTLTVVLVTMKIERQGDNMAFLGWFGHYLLVFVIIAVVAGAGIFVGKKLSDRKDAQAKNAAEAEEVK